MSSFKFRSLAHVVVVAGLSLGLSACFRPLYGPTASGQSLQTVLGLHRCAGNRVAAGAREYGHYLRSEMIYALNGSGSDTPKKFNLKLAMRESQSTPVVDSETGCGQLRHRRRNADLHPDEPGRKNGGDAQALRPRRPASTASRSASPTLGRRGMRRSGSPRSWRSR